MAISIRLSDSDTKLFKKYAELHGITVSELVRRSVIERIEDEYDLKAYEDAVAEFEKNPVTYSHDEVCRMLELE